MGKNQQQHEGDVPGISSSSVSMRPCRIEGPGVTEDNMMKGLVRKCGTAAAIVAQGLENTTSMRMRVQSLTLLI